MQLVPDLNLHLLKFPLLHRGLRSRSPQVESVDTLAPVLVSIAAYTGKRGGQEARLA